MQSAEFRQVIAALLVGGATLAATAVIGPASQGVLAAQQQQQHQHQQGHPRQPQTTLPPTEISPLDLPTMTDNTPSPMNPQRVKLFNDDRHKKLVSDVDRLVSLTNELKADLDRTSKDELSLDVMKKAGQIEKLAHDVQNRMKN